MLSEDFLLDKANLDRIKDPETRQAVVLLANLLEQSLTDIDGMRAEIQRLRDENNRLKGEQGKPDIKPSKRPQQGPDGDHSSEKQRGTTGRTGKRAKNDTIVLDRTETLNLDRETLPADAKFKGYETVIVQNLILKTDNICFQREKYYSASMGKTYLAPLPLGYEGAFGPDLKTLILTLHHLGNVSQPCVHTLLTNAGIQISTGWIGDFLIAEQEAFHAEKTAIGRAGLESSPWHGTDDTATRVNGVNQHCHVLGNPLYTVYTTLAKKDRRAVLSVLQNGHPLLFLLTKEVLASEAATALPRKWRKLLSTWPLGKPMDEASATELLNVQMPTLGAQARKKLLDTMAVSGYQAQTEVPVVDLLLCDDAPQFKLLTQNLGLCWVHDGRNYQKLTPHLPLHQEILEAFKLKYWKYYSLLLDYQTHPTPEKRKRLWEEFDNLFVPDTGYAHLDHRIQQTAANKENLLQVLAHPEIPLHNNASELAVRRRVRKRDVSFGPRSADGVAAWDTFQTIAATAQKLGVSFIAYIADRISRRNEMPPLATIITERARLMNLGASWK
jgi:hypothetical protein